MACVCFFYFRSYERFCKGVSEVVPNVAYEFGRSCDDHVRLFFILVFHILTLVGVSDYVKMWKHC